MGRRISLTPGIPLHPTGTFTSHHIGPGTAYSRIFDRLVRIQSHMVTSSRFNYLLVMIDSVLSVMRMSVGKSTRITGFQYMNTFFGIPLDRFFHLAFVVGNISSGFMMSDDLNIFLTCITDYFINIKISVRFGKIKILHTTPALPAFVPPLE